MAYRSRRFVTSCIMLALAATLGGCAYMADRGNDAKDNPEGTQQGTQGAGPDRTEG